MEEIHRGVKEGFFTKRHQPREMEPQPQHDDLSVGEQLKLTGGDEEKLMETHRNNRSGE